MPVSVKVTGYEEQIVIGSETVEYPNVDQVMKRVSLGKRPLQHRLRESFQRNSSVLAAECKVTVETSACEESCD